MPSQCTCASKTIIRRPYKEINSETVNGKQMTALEMVKMVKTLETEHTNGVFHCEIRLWKQRESAAKHFTMKTSKTGNTNRMFHGQEFESTEN